MAPSISTDMKHVHLVKRHGHLERYDPKKVYASVYAAALNCHYTEKQSERIAAVAMRKVNAFVGRKKAFTSAEIRDKVLEVLDDKDVALMYRHHLDVC